MATKIENKPVSEAFLTDWLRMQENGIIKMFTKYEFNGVESAGYEFIEGNYNNEDIEREVKKYLTQQEVKFDNNATALELLCRAQSHILNKRRTN
ncbi:Uncharacterised protein [Candidatus Tiddalikarchaeum anstoanum]|nr:Uncharacterised protein [Candidatus Tiddalikarchaeum anstoanum]